MKMKRFWALGLVMLILSGGLVWFALESYPEMKYVEDRQAYLQSLDWYIEPSSDHWFSQMGYEREELIYRHYPGEKDGVGLIKPDRRTILPAAYEDIVYYGGDYFAAHDETDWFVFDFQGHEVGRMPRETGHLFYAGGTYFLRYPDFKKMGFEIVDGVSGKVIKTFDDCYNGTWLPDGTWFISREVNTEIFDRMVDDRELYRRFGSDYFDTSLANRGFFLDEDMEPKYDGQEYGMVLAGNDCHIADRIEQGHRGERVMLRDNREQFVIQRGTRLYDCAEVGFNEPRYGLSWDADGRYHVKAFLYGENGCADSFNDDIFDGDGNHIKQVVGSHMPYWLDVTEDGMYSLMMADGKDEIMVLEPWFGNICVLYGGYAAEVYVDGMSGIVKLKGGEQDVE